MSVSSEDKEILENIKTIFRKNKTKDFCNLSHLTTKGQELFYALDTSFRLKHY